MSKTAADFIPDASFLAEKGFAIKPISQMDLDQRLELLSIRNAPDVRRNMYDSHVIDQHSHLAWCRRMAKSQTDHIFGVAEADVIVGQFGLRAISWDDRRCDWAFYLADGLRGRGLGGAIERTVLRHVFKDLGFLKLNCEIIEFNVAVIDMHKRFGFRIEGIRRQHVLRDGKAFDVVCMGMLCDELVE
jgi:UDP-4-amino-4,6-dideoxy-N-acetyl-beta-L-altrosamine N-acetyltransferase